MSHEDQTHSPAPLPGTDAAPMHAAVDALAAALHEYVETAVGVRAEFGAAESDEDPRILALENRVGQLNAGLFDRLHDALGMHPDLTSSVWRPAEDVHDHEDAHDVPEGIERAEVFYLGFVVAAPPAGVDMTLDGMIDVLDEAGEEATNRFAEAGYDVVEWAASRGAAPGFGDDDEDDE
ncbi:hypothetical protein Xcel_1020 [Xylanimonas cellulosilytica DSM 15894]|uniref:Uncharacterized protein n=1 Tax=Xylanimonas cellulosilytica (strain DSM 15894 / JCM 12276 / CECT 5975 / KCTC 9989 / LMG 20990 / NBRC 107835 / XIL07) TaxID=446471 RepID=D1BYX6_XYLCX|nr:hypothetical protein [Xylanimonas cellulosilytica]ACZ30051.1 hypothetical protein Xcel_1020 [Xylanimonas cellulosilytica DSM 15894]